MVNPDGVVAGNYRTSFSGRDLNRKFYSKDLERFPEIKAIKKQLAELKK